MRMHVKTNVQRSVQTLLRYVSHEPKCRRNILTKTLCFKTWPSSLTPTFMSLSDLTVICQCRSASLLAVTDGASLTPLTLYFLCTQQKPVKGPASATFLVEGTSLSTGDLESPGRISEWQKATGRLKRSVSHCACPGLHLLCSNPTWTVPVDAQYRHTFQCYWVRG